jgi:hypothetical protein
MPGKRLTDADEARICELYGEGLSRNGIAKRSGFANRTVTRVLAKHGLPIDRAAPLEGIAARSIDLAAKRQQLAARLLEDAERLRQQMWLPCTVHAFGGRDNAFNSEVLAEPCPADRASLMRAVATCVDRSLRLDEYGKEGAVPTARSMLAKLGEAMAAAVADEETGPE